MISKNFLSLADRSLTTGVDTVVGTAGNDSIVGTQDGTWNSSDSIDGGAGNDTITIVHSQAATALNAPIVDNVENLVLRVTVDAATDGADAVDMDNFAGVTNLNLFRTVGANDVTDVANGTTVSFTELAASADTTVTFKASGVTGAADAATVNFNGVTAAADIELAGAVESITINATGAASSLADLVLDAATTTLAINADEALTVATTFTNAGVTSLTVTGDSLVTLTPALGAATLTVDASANTGGLTATTVAAVRTLTGTNTVDTITVGAAAATTLNVSTGAGNDVVTVDALDLTGSVVTGTSVGTIIDGGEGTGDILVANELDLTASAFITNITKTSGFEILRLSNANTTANATIALSAADITEMTAFQFSGALNHAADTDNTRNATIAVTNVLSANTFTFRADISGEEGTAAADENGSDAVTFAPQTDGGADTLNITLNGSVDIVGGAAVDNGANDGETSGDAIDASTFEIVNITSTNRTDNTAANTLLGGDAAGGTTGVGVRVNTNGTVNISGAEDLTLTVGGTNSSVIGTAATGILTITGEAGNNIIKGGSAADVLTGGTGTDELTGGAGVDAFVFATATDTEAAAGGVGADSITDYASTDILRLTAANNTAGASGTAGTTATSNVEIATGGKVTFAAADDTLTEMLVAIAADDTDVADAETVFFEFNGDTYIYGAGADTTSATDDFLIKLVGVTGKTTLLESTAAAGDFTLA